MYYALVVFKTEEALERLGDSKFLQTKINTIAKKAIGFAANPFLAGEEQMLQEESEDDGDEDLTDEQRAEKKRQQARQRELERQGFTMVTLDDARTNRRKGRDSYGTVVQGVTEAEMKRIVEQQKLRQQQNQDEGPGYTTNRDKKNQIKQDFYMFQKRIAMKNELESLREGFEKDRKRLAKALAKKDAKINRQGNI